MIIRSVGVLSVAKIFGLLYAVMGLLIGAIISVVSLVGTAFSGTSPGAGRGFFGLLFGVAAIIFVPVFYGLLGALSSALGAIFYNLAAQRVGGLSIDLIPEPPPRQLPFPEPPAA